MLLHKLVCGLHSVVLKEEVFREFESFSDVDSLRNFCIAFEAAQKDARHVAEGGSFGRESVAGAAGVMSLPDEQADEPLLTAGAHHWPARQPQARPPTTPDEALWQLWPDTQARERTVSRRGPGLPQLW
ncbi:hypothetical protein E2C01_059017 [Portunus trituberculatus]|uniref:Uncharacterized protein n=1 Tax=Portunus trituberculatus TaxID=210409 RepID=A0A5B7H5P7_PORTR|nr:hypothetical protein [Portunus trituberculatus]